MKLAEKIKPLQAKDQIALLTYIGVGTSFHTCYICGQLKKKDDFYLSSDPASTSGVTRICKSCATDIATQKTNEGVEQEPTRESVMLALEYLDRPFLSKLWESSVLETNNLVSGRKKLNYWTSYVKNVAMPQYNTMRWKDSDIFQAAPGEYLQEEELPKDQEILEAYEKNKADTVRLLGYDPFEKEQLSDQPFLYAQLIGYLDASEDSNDDAMRVSSIVEIVKGFSHIEKLNDIIAMLMRSVENLEVNISTIKALEDTKTKITGNIQKLAQESCISLKNSKNAAKGENTWTGKIKKLKDMNLREAEVNLFDIGTSEGMRQVADISHASIIKQIKLDENDYTDMLIEQKNLIEKLSQSSQVNEERARILLRENLDLKSYLESLGLLSPVLLEQAPLIDGLVEDLNNEP